MSPQHSIKLRYFDARGRVQFMRCYFLARGIAFEDHRVPLSAEFSEWMAMRDDRTVTGPFKRLPVLEFDGERIPETLVIAEFLHRRLGDADRLPDEENRRHSVLLSSVYCDLLLPLGMMLWMDRMCPGVDLEAYLRFTLGRLNGYLAVLDETLGNWKWGAGRDPRPTLAGCLLWDQLDAVRILLGGAVDLAALPRLDRFYREHPDRERFLEYAVLHPCQFSGRPGEAEVIANVHRILGAATAGTAATG